MKLLVTLALLVSLKVIAAGAEADGCFALYMPGLDGGALCVNGAAEEGIGGASATVAIVSTVGETYWCAKTTKITDKSKDKNISRVFSFDRKTRMLEVELNGKVNAEGKQEGDIKITDLKDKTNLKYLELSQKTTDRILPKALDSKLCQAARNS